MRRRNASSASISEEKTILDAAKKYLSRSSITLKDDEDLLLLTGLRFKLLQADYSENNEDVHRISRELDLWHMKAIKQYNEDTLLCQTFAKHKFCLFEKRIFICLLAAELGLTDRISDISDLQNSMFCSYEQRLKIIHYLDNEKRLCKSELIYIDSDSRYFCDRNITVDKLFVESLTKKEKSYSNEWEVKNVDELLKKLFQMVKSLESRSMEISNEWRYDVDSGLSKSLSVINKKIDRLNSTFLLTLNHHKDWRLCSSLLEGLSCEERQLTIILLLNDMGLINSWDDASKGEELAKAISCHPTEINCCLKLLSEKSALRKKGIIRVSIPSIDGKIDDEINYLRTSFFELDPVYLKEIGFTAKKRECKLSKKPNTIMSNLVLHSEVKQAVDIAMNQLKNHEMIFKDWGLGKTITYGRSVTLLFSGAPGVGKTACAEAIADELDKNILVADYSQIQNCYVGATEKNIAKVFKSAMEENAVLFWDEADAMFYDRDSASRNWEVRDVNVLLQELERFEGVCILSTNRKVTLDKAVERRISMKIDFQPPTAFMSKEIWKKLLPREIPLDKGIDFDELSTYGLTGGEIKNVVLNAARKAAGRGRKSTITMQDLLWGVNLENSGRLSSSNTNKAGFLR